MQSHGISSFSLAYRLYAKQAQWALKWPDVSAGNQMYVAQNGATEQWVVAGSPRRPPPMEAAIPRRRGDLELG
jgi:hypothetical protein